jgi:hypothetical protein
VGGHVDVGRDLLRIADRRLSERIAVLPDDQGRAHPLLQPRGCIQGRRRPHGIHAAGRRPSRGNQHRQQRRRPYGMQHGDAQPEGALDEQGGGPGARCDQGHQGPAFQQHVHGQPATCQRYLSLEGSHRAPPASGRHSGPTHILDRPGRLLNSNCGPALESGGGGR